MATLHPSPTPLTLADVDVERADDRPHGRQVFLILHPDARLDHRARTVGTRCRQRGVVRFIDARGNRSSSPASVVRPSAPTRLSPMALPSGLRERGRLPETGAARRVELLLETLVLPFHLIALTLRARQLLAQAGDFVLLALDQIVAWVASRARALIGHTTFMADSREKYKYGNLDLAPLSGATR